MNDMVYKAILLAIEAHKGQRDRAKKPYISHPVYLALSMDTDEEKMAALLHDVVEDSDYTIEELRNYGFSDNVVNAVEKLTHNQGISYMDYIKNLSTDSIAKKVKIADLHHNCDTSRLEKITKTDMNRIDKYKKALKYLEQ